VVPGGRLSFFRPPNRLGTLDARPPPAFNDRHMPDFRVHVPSAAPEALELILPPAETHHLVTVNRARPGDPVVAFDGAGTEWSCVLDRVEGKKAAVLRVTRHTRRAPLACALTLGQGLPKGATMDDIVRQATELGAAVIAPLATTRSEVRLDDERAAKKSDKWRAVAIEAAKQCGNPFLPAVTAVQGLEAFLAATQAAATELRLVASLHPGARPLRTVLASWRAAHEGRAPHSAAWLIGPEGDLTAEEVERALAAGFIPVTLGPLVLRCDTAAACALSVLRIETEG
jgi:16S rRNA (uracil1498-N3)-methyltransferase